MLLTTNHPQRLFPSGTWRPRALCTTHSYVASFYSTWHDAAADRQTKAYMIHCNNLTDRQFVELISESSVCLPPMPVIADGRLSSSHAHSDVEDRQANSKFCNTFLSNETYRRICLRRVLTAVCLPPMPIVADGCRWSLMDRRILYF